MRRPWNDHDQKNTVNNGSKVLSWTHSTGEGDASAGPVDRTLGNFRGPAPAEPSGTAKMRSASVGEHGPGKALSPISGVSVAVSRNPLTRPFTIFSPSREDPKPCLRDVAAEVDLPSPPMTWAIFHT